MELIFTTTTVDSKMRLNYFSLSLILAPDNLSQISYQLHGRRHHQAYQCLEETIKCINLKNRIFKFILLNPISILIPSQFLRLEHTWSAKQIQGLIYFHYRKRNVIKRIYGLKTTNLFITLKQIKQIHNTSSNLLQQRQRPEILLLSSCTLNIFYY